MLLTLAKRIRKSDFEPDVIVGVSRGGWPPARIISDLLENQNLANMRVVFYKDIGVRNRRPVITQPVTSDVAGKRVLVVDDVADSGLSLKAVSSHLTRKRARDLRVCTIYLKPNSVFVPDFFARVTSKWIIFPWERLEALRLLSKKTGGNSARVMAQLKNSGISSRLVKQLMRIGVVPGKD